MMDIKASVAKNITQLRQAHQMTQLQLAEQLNYSDKAVSKWEHGDSMPDISVLVKIADLFSVSLDELIRGDRSSAQETSAEPHKYRYSRGIITAIAILSVWLLAFLAFVLISLILENAQHQWLCFLLAIPISSVVWLVLNSIWGSVKKSNYGIISLLMWSSLLSLHLTCFAFGKDVRLIYLLGIPGQIIILLWSFMKKRSKQ